jgi:hypothetical protein
MGYHSVHLIHKLSVSHKNTLSYTRIMYRDSVASAYILRNSHCATGRRELRRDWLHLSARPAIPFFCQLLQALLKRSRAPTKTCTLRSFALSGTHVDGPVAGLSLSSSSAVSDGQARDTYSRIFLLARSDRSVAQLDTR